MTINKDFSSAVVEDLVSRCVNTAEEGGDLGASIVEKLKEIFEISEKFAENNDDNVLRLFILKKLDECAKDEIDRSAKARVKGNIKERSEKGAKKMMANEIGKNLPTDDLLTMPMRNRRFKSHLAFKLTFSAFHNISILAWYPTISA